MYVFAFMQPKSARTISTNNHYLCVGIGFCADWISSMHVCIGGFLVARIYKCFPLENVCYVVHEFNYTEDIAISGKTHKTK